MPVRFFFANARLADWLASNSPSFPGMLTNWKRKGASAPSRIPLAGRLSTWPGASDQAEVIKGSKHVWNQGIANDNT